VGRKRRNKINAARSRTLSFIITKLKMIALSQK